MTKVYTKHKGHNGFCSHSPRMLPDNKTEVDMARWLRVASDLSWLPLNSPFQLHQLYFALFVGNFSLTRAVEAQKEVF